MDCVCNSGGSLKCKVVKIHIEVFLIASWAPKIRTKNVKIGITNAIT